MKQIAVIIAITMLIATGGAYNSNTTASSNSTPDDRTASSAVAPRHQLQAHRIVCIGDSITEGFADPDNWPYHLKTRLDEDWDVIDRGVGGAFTADMLNHTDAALELDPQFVVIAGGINDLRNGVPLEAIQINIDAICTRVESYGGVPVLCTVTPTNSRLTQLDDLNSWITAYARLKGYDLIDFYMALSDKSNPGHSDPALVLWDGIHPNPAGYAAMGNAINLAIFTGGNQLSPHSTDISNNDASSVHTSNTADKLP